MTWQDHHDRMMAHRKMTMIVRSKAQGAAWLVHFDFGLELHIAEQIDTIGMDMDMDKSFPVPGS